MTFLWVVLILISIIGIIAALTSRNQKVPSDDNCSDNSQFEGGGCCGEHITCEKDSLLSAVSPTIEYYDDEELDSYKGKNAEDYSEVEVEEFRDILVTLQNDDVAGWIRSLQNRGINIPNELLPEIYLVVGENRELHERK